MYTLRDQIKLSDGIWYWLVQAVRNGKLELYEGSAGKYVREPGTSVLYRVHSNTYRALGEVARQRADAERRREEYRQQQAEKQQAEQAWLEGLKAWREAHWSEELDATREPNMEEKRAEFVRWLIEHGRMGEEVEA